MMDKMRSREEQERLFLTRYTPEWKNDPAWRAPVVRGLYQPERSPHGKPGYAVDLVENMHKWSWWKIAGWLAYAVFVGVLVFALMAGAWWVIIRALNP